MSAPGRPEQHPREILERLADGGTAALDDFVRQCALRPLADGDVVALARMLAGSGDQLAGGLQDRADVASTGAPSSLTTLLGPLYLRAMGLSVPTLGVAGRPAGGVDVLATIPGFRVDLNAREASAALARAGHIHLAAGGSWAPLDAALFKHRRRVGAQARPELVIASLLAKKLAVGVRRAGFDVRVAPWGNFGAGPEEAARNARRLIDVFAAAGVTAGCMLTDARVPYQPHIGRGESLVALHRVLTSAADDELAGHAELCRLISLRTAGRGSAGAADPRASAAARAAFALTLEAQGSSWERFEARVAEILDAPTAALHAKADGRLVVDLRAVRDALTARQRDGSEDPCGVTLRARAGTWAARGDTLADVRGSDAALIAELERAITTSARAEAADAWRLPRWTAADAE